MPESQPLDFDTGKLSEVAKRRCGKEYAMLAVVLAITTLPYVALCLWRPKLGLIALALVVVFKAVTAFASSASSGLSHHIRFLLAGSNPIGMSGAASMMLGAVDSMFDWKEDAPQRRKSPLHFWCTTILKFLTTPLGAVLFGIELLWDLILLRRGFRLWRCKWNEFFALAKYHSLICPEKSNDIFYADFAYARYCDNVFLYQWNRMRAMVFELQHYKIDIEEGVGSDKTNLFRVGSLAAYQILKRLEIEQIENALELHFDSQPEDFPLPKALSQRLVTNARPLEHYLRMQRELLDVGMMPKPKCELEMAIKSRVPPDLIWHALRILDDSSRSRYVTDRVREALVSSRVLVANETEYELDAEFVTEIERFLATHWTQIDESDHAGVMKSKIPCMFSLRGTRFQPGE